MKKQIVLGFFLVQLFLLHGQVNRKTFPLSREFKKSGFSITPLATVSFGNKSEEREFSNFPGLVYNHTEIGRGTWNAGLEVGYLKFYDGYKIGDYFEGAIAYKRFSGVHYLEGDLASAPANLNALETYEFENSWQYQSISASVRAMDIAFQKPNRFLVWGIGVNYDYLIASRFDADYPVGFLENNNTPFDNKHSLRAHFQVGYGFKMSKHLFLIPTLETPLLRIFPSSNINPAIQFLNVNYQPLIIGLKFMILRKDPVNCNAPQLKTMPTK